MFDCRCIRSHCLLLGWCICRYIRRGHFRRIIITRCLCPTEFKLRTVSIIGTMRLRFTIVTCIIPIFATEGVTMHGLFSTHGWFICWSFGWFRWFLLCRYRTISTTTRIITIIISLSLPPFIFCITTTIFIGSCIRPTIGQTTTRIRTSTITSFVNYNGSLLLLSISFLNLFQRLTTINNSMTFSKCHT